MASGYAASLSLDMAIVGWCRWAPPFAFRCVLAMFLIEERRRSEACAALTSIVVSVAKL
jgi:hypothetical protein